MPTNKLFKNAFTIIEVLVVMGIMVVILSISYVSLIKPQVSVTTESQTLTLLNDLKSTQLKAMTSDNNSYGVYFNNNSYTIFEGTSYNASLPSNITYNLNSSVEFTSVNLPSNQIVFNALNGEVLNYSSSQNSFNLTHNNGASYSFSFNSLGVFNVTN